MQTSTNSAASLRQTAVRSIRNSQLGALIKRSPLWPVLRPRRFHLYCLGAPRTGTTSMAELFRKNYRAEHEPGMPELVRAIEAKIEGRLDHASALAFVEEHDRQLRLEFESSHPMATFAPALVEAFPEARFIVTIRDCYSWLDSMIDQHLSSFSDPNLPEYWPRLNELYHGERGASTTGDEDPLRSRGLYSLEGYLAYWGDHYTKIFQAIPPDRLLTVRTDRMSSDVDRIAAFAGVAPETLDVERRHSHRSSKKHRLVEALNQDLLERVVDRCCRDIMDQHFPEISSNPLHR